MYVWSLLSSSSLAASMKLQEEVAAPSQVGRIEADGSEMKETNQRPATNGVITASVKGEETKMKKKKVKMETREGKTVEEGKDQWKQSLQDQDMVVSESLSHRTRRSTSSESKHTHHIL